MKELLKVKRFIEENKMLEKNDSVILAVSGGADSVCLYKMFVELKKDYNLNLMVVHVHHGIRGYEADRDMEFVWQMCEADGIKFRLVKRNVPAYAKEMGLSEEEAGRILRYEAFENMANELGENSKIAVAHNMNDSIETFMHNLCRGTGIKGLSGILAVNGRIIRPVLCLKREEIENYIKENDFEYINDSTNFSNDYTRNKIRNEVIPYLKKNINGESDMHIYNVSKELKSISAYFDKVVKCLYEKAVKKDSDRICIDMGLIADEDEYIESLLIRKVIENMAGKLKDITRIHISDVMDLKYKQSGKYIVLPYNILVKREYNKIVFYKEDDINQGVLEENEAEIQSDGEYKFGENVYEVQILEVEKEGIDIESYEKILKSQQKMYTKCFDYDKIKFAVKIRYKAEGDYLVVNAAGNKKKLKTYFINEKIPSEKRGEIPLVCDGNHVIWVVGYRISEAYKVTSNTKKILVISRREKL